MKSRSVSPSRHVVINETNVRSEKIKIFLGYKVEGDVLPFESEKVNKEEHIKILRNVFYNNKKPINPINFQDRKGPDNLEIYPYKVHYNSTEMLYVKNITNNFTGFGDYKVGKIPTVANITDFMTYLSIHPFFAGYSSFNSRIATFEYIEEEMGSFRLNDMSPNRPEYKYVNWQRIQYLKWIKLFNIKNIFETVITELEVFPTEQKIPLCYYGSRFVTESVKDIISII